MGDRLGVAVGLMGSEDPADSAFRNPKGRRLLRVLQFGPQNPAMGVLKSPGNPYRACVRRAFWRYHYLRAFSGVDTVKEFSPKILQLYII